MISGPATLHGASSTAPTPTRRRPPAWFLGATLAVAALTIHLLEACSFKAHDTIFDSPEKLYSVLNTAPYADDSTVSSGRSRVIDAPKLKVDQGYTCARADRAAAEHFIGMRVFESATLPANFDGTVFLNGWYLDYQVKDHQVGGLGSTIFNITQNGNELTWDAGGAISDRNGDDAYGWCYRYTIVAWARNLRGPIGQLPKPRIDMHAIHADATGKLVFVDRSLGGSHITTRNAKFKTPGTRPRGRLLTGFGVGFDDDSHRLLQFGFELGKSILKGRTIKWNTNVILKDNSSREYGASQLATVVTGESVNVWTPDIVLLEAGDPQAPGYLVNDLELSPRGNANACISGDSEHTYTFRIDNVPFDWAVPMLTGWELGDYCDDNNVQKIGAWIQDFAWERNPGDSFGTLHYTVQTVLQDKKPFAGVLDGIQVEVLGINLLVPPGNGS